MRFGYAGFLSGLGAGGRHVEYPNATHEDFTGDGRLRWQRGWFRVTVSVPADWFGIGMLPELVEGHQPGECDRCAGTGRSTAGEGASVACWPDRPGLRFTTWADGTELELAASFGWRFVVHEGIERDEAKPLDVWRKRLLDVRQQLAALVTAGELDARTAKLAAGALRMVVLQTVGAFASQGHPITHVVGSVNEVPDGTPFTIQGDAIVWTDHSGGIAWGELSHPEWAAAVWARCRARVLHDRGVWPHTGALAAWTAGQLVAIRQDAVWLADDPHWRPFASCAARPREATTNPEGIGHYRLDAQLGRAVPWPSSTSEIVKWKG